ncbi:hypothetical protein EVAR_69814_1 [Eumeta japonica]|uniref:Uncharacterized protein n=1 Tax=Eumeta variegata TaxID=151549 RepID=A0A4C1Z5J9_EUMVA|nr:hypothetical protein EVAR_69814_1 [Eumeta japonica]
MLRNLYLTLKGYDKVPPSLAAEYMEIMRKAKAGKAISWVDEDEDRATADIQFKYISSLDLEELCDKSGKYSIDSTRTVTPAKKVKTEFINNIATDIENFANGCIDPLNLNSTFVLAGKMEDKLSTKMEPVKRGLVDKTNTMPRHITFNDRAKIVKPVVGKALPFRRPPASAPLRPAFGSSAPREAQRTVQGQCPCYSLVTKQCVYGNVSLRKRIRTPDRRRPHVDDQQTRLAAVYGYAWL